MKSKNKIQSLILVLAYVIATVKALLLSALPRWEKDLFDRTFVDAWVLTTIMIIFYCLYQLLRAKTNLNDKGKLNNRPGR